MCRIHERSHLSTEKDLGQSTENRKLYLFMCSNKFATVSFHNFIIWKTGAALNFNFDIWHNSILFEALYSEVDYYYYYMDRLYILQYFFISKLISHAQPKILCWHINFIFVHSIYVSKRWHSRRHSTDTHTHMNFKPCCALLCLISHPPTHKDVCVCVYACLAATLVDNKNTHTHTCEMRFAI